MKVKTFILTFLMMMSSPFLFGQHWVDPDLGTNNTMPISATITLDGELQTDESYQVAAFHGNTLLEVQSIIAFVIPNGGGTLYHVDMDIPYVAEKTQGIYFKLFNGTNEYVSSTKINWDEDGFLHTNPLQIYFKAVAQIEGTEYDVVYPSLQEAIDAAANGDVVTLLEDNAENVTVVQAPNVAFTIEGAEKTMGGTITVNGKSAAYATAGLTIKNVNFDATNIDDASIMLGVSGDNNTRYTNGVTVQDCDFEGNGQTKVAIKNYTGGCKNLTVTGGTFTGLHSLMQVKGVDGLAVSGVNVSDCKNGVSVGTSTNVAISDSNITATGYGVRADGSGAYEMTLNDNTISAELPVVVRKATGDYNLEVNGGSYTASNAEGYDVVFTNGDDGTYEAPTGVFQLTIDEGTDLNVFPVYVAKIGTKGYQSLAEAIAAVGDGDVVIELLADVTFDYNARDAYGTTGTTSLTINGSGKTLTLNQKNSDWASFGLANADAKVVFNNMTIEKTGYGDTGGAWNTHAIIFSSNVEMTDVTVNNSMAVQNGATLTNVTINEANGYYGLWINGNGQSVTMNGGSITATNGGRGIKIADQYIDAPALVTLNVTGTKFNTAKKAAVLVSSKAGADITASNVDITNVAEDKENFAWVDEDWAAHYGKVTVEGGALGQENLPAFAAALMNSDKVEGYYETLPEAVAAAQDGNTITMLKNDNVTATVEVNNNITIDLNGKTVTANCKKAFEVYANATIKNGTIWSQQRCVDTRKNVELTLADVTLEAPTYYSTHKNQQPLTIGGSDNGTKVTMTNVNINAGTQGYAIISYVKTDLTATDSYFSGYSALYVKEGSEGSEFNFVGSTLKGDLGSNDVEGNSFATIATEAVDVTVTLDANSKLEAVGDNQFAIVLRAEENNITVAGDITAPNFLSGNVNNNTIKVKAGYADKLLAEGYATTEADANGLVEVSGPAVAKIGDTYYETLAEAFAAAQNGDEVEILVAGTYALTTSGKNIAITGAVDGVVFDNIGAKNMGSANVTFNNVTFDYYPNVNYTGLQHSGNLVYNDCTINGQVFLYGTSETFNNCIFNQNSADAYNVWTYGAKEVAFNVCTFNSVGKSVLIYTESATTFNKVTVTDCDFIASAPVEGKAAIEMDSSLSDGINLTIDGATTATGFGSGNVSGNSLWNNKKDNETEANNDITVVVNGETVLEPWTPVAKIGETPYETLAKAISAATADQTITICSDVNENVTVNKNVTIDGGGDKNYTGTMTISNGKTVTVKNVNFDKGCIDKSKGTSGTLTVKDCTFDGVDGSINYAVTMRGGNSVTIEGGVVKNYDYGMLYVPSAVSNVSVKGTTVEGGGYGVHVAYGTKVNIEDVTMTNVAYGIMTQNYGAKTITIKNSNISATNPIYVWERNTTFVDTFKFEGANTFSGLTLSLSAQAKLVLAATDATLTAPEGYNVTTSVENYLVKYENGVYVVKPAVAKIGETYYETLTEAINAADDGATIQLLPVTINEYVAPWITDTQHTSEKSITILGSKDDEGKLATTLTAGMYLGYEDGQCREHTIVVKDVKFEGKGLKVACQQKVTIEGNQFNDITEGQAIAVVGKNIESVVKDNVIDNVAAAQGIELRNTLTATVEGNIISNTGHNALQITSQVGATASEIDVINNTMSNWGKGGEGRAMRINDIVTANINGNVMSHTAAPEEFVKVTGSTTLDASANYWNGVSPLTDGMFTGVEGDLVPVLKSYYTDAEKQNLVELSPSVAKIGEEYYPSLAAAITAAQPGETIVLLADITENVTVNKNLTIDGKAADATANSKYTGTMTVNTSLTVTVQNVNFVKGSIAEAEGTRGNLTVKGCNFDGVDKSIGYAVTVRGGDNLTIENSTAMNYSTGMLYIPRSVTNIAIKDVEVSNVTAAFNISYSGDGTFENVKVDNVTYGLHVQNYGARTFTLNDCVMNNVDFPTYIQKKSTAIVTFKFNNVLGYKETINSGSNQANYGNYVLTSTAAKLTNVADDFNVTVSDDLADNGYVVEYNEGVYSVVAGNVLNSTTGKKYATIQDAIDAAQTGDKVVLLKDVDLSTNQFVILDNSYNTYFKVEGKAVTIDLNGKKISGEYASSPMLVGVFSTDNNGHLILEDSSAEKGGAVNVTTAEGYTVYSLIANYEPGCSITINGGTYTLDKASDSHIYSGSTNGETEGVTVNGGVFKLGNVGKGSNGKPWMFNVLGSNDGNVVVKGGTFDADINHQFWAHEVYVPETLALKDNGDYTWTVVASVAYVGETATSTGSTERKVGYATIEDAIEAIGIRNTNETVTMLKDVELENTITIAAGKEIILDLNGNVISAPITDQLTKSFAAITNKGTLTVKDSGTEGKISVSYGGSSFGYGIGLYTISNEGGVLNIESGIIENTTTVSGSMYDAIDNNSTLGETVLNISGGEVKCAQYIGVRQFANSTTKDNIVNVTGGKVLGGNTSIWMQNPGSNQPKATIAISEDANIEGRLLAGESEEFVFAVTGGTFDTDVTDFCAEGYGAIANATETLWTVMPVQEQHLVAGWNWYSSYLDIETADLTGAIGSNATEIKDQNDGSMTYDEAWGWSGSLTLDFAKMYMINTTEACELKLAADLLNPADHKITLGGGWNWIGYPSNVSVSVNEALKNLTPQEGDIIKTRNLGHAEYAWGEWVGELTMVPGEGYMYRNTAVDENENPVVKEFYYTVETTSRGTVEANYTAENKHWVPNVSEYPFNMTMTAVVDGMTNGNYEVAAFVNGEVRGSARPIYVEQLDAYVLFLTINGDEVEEMSFRLYDIDNDTEYDLNDRFNYSNNAHLGSVSEPYVFSRGTTGIGEAAMSNINIYPNPTTIGTEINLEATCDIVEVYNALGVKVAEYQNVDTIDALETAGIYVIRITNNGNVQNCRLVVK